MKLTGKAKQLFEAWLLDHDMHNEGDLLPNYLKWFYALHPSFQWGFLQDWADSVGYDIYFNPYYDWTKEIDTGFKWYCAKRNDSYISETGLKDTIQESRNAAIEKLNQLINDK